MDENVEMDEWILAHEWLGIVYPQDTRNAASLITPLAYDDARWCAFSEYDRKGYFPNNGKIVYYHSSDCLPLELDRLYQFKIRYSYSFDKEHRNSSFYATENTLSPKHLAQLFNWSSHASHIFDIVAYLQQGIPAEECLSRTIYISYLDRFYGPIQLIPSRGNPLLLQPQAYLDGGSSLMLHGYTVRKDDIVKIDEKEFIDNRFIGSPVDRVDLSHPQIVIKNVLEASKYISKRDDEYLVKRRIKELATAFNSLTEFAD